MMFGIYICMCIKSPVVQHIKNAKYGSLPVNTVHFLLIWCYQPSYNILAKKKIRRSLGYKFL
jgi:hypothetical protein